MGFDVPRNLNTKLFYQRLWRGGLILCPTRSSDLTLRGSYEEICEKVCLPVLVQALYHVKEMNEQVFAAVGTEPLENVWKNITSGTNQMTRVDDERIKQLQILLKHKKIKSAVFSNIFKRVQDFLRAL